VPDCADLLWRDDLEHLFIGIGEEIPMLDITRRKFITLLARADEVIE